jgi:acetyl esterase
MLIQEQVNCVIKRLILCNTHSGAIATILNDEFLWSAPIPNLEEKLSMNILNTLRTAGLLLQLKLLQFRRNIPPLPGGILDEQVNLLLRAQQQTEAVPLDEVTVDQLRRNMRDSISIWKRVGVLFEKIDSELSFEIPGPPGGIPVRLYRPSGDTGLPVFILLHGGGWVMGDMDTHDNMARFICQRAQCLVLSVNYRLAPEHPFPAAVEDSFAAICWAAEHAAEIGGDPHRLLVGGDSAGGNLAAVVAHMAARQGGPNLVGQVLLYPATNGASLDTPSYQDFGGRDYSLSRHDMEWFMGQYLPNPAGWLDPRASPLLEQDLHGLAPALVVTAEFDVLRDEAEEYARRLEAAGGRVTLLRCNGMTHGFLSMVGLIQRVELYFDQVIAGIGELVRS